MDFLDKKSSLAMRALDTDVLIASQPTTLSRNNERVQRQEEKPGL
jgi:hypothetical protein